MAGHELLERIKRAVTEIEPDATVILYGSRARGDAKEDSDWDFLILVDGDVNSVRTDRIREAVYDVELISGEILSAIVRNRREWETEVYRAMPIHERIDAEGILL